MRNGLGKITVGLGITAVALLMTTASIGTNSLGVTAAFAQSSDGQGNQGGQGQGGQGSQSGQGNQGGQGSGQGGPVLILMVRVRKPEVLQTVRPVANPLGRRKVSPRWSSVG